MLTVKQVFYLAKPKPNIQLCSFRKILHQALKNLVTFDEIHYLKLYSYRAVQVHSSTDLSPRPQKKKEAKKKKKKRKEDMTFPEESRHSLYCWSKYEEFNKHCVFRFVLLSDRNESLTCSPVSTHSPPPLFFSLDALRLNFAVWRDQFWTD